MADPHVTIQEDNSGLGVAAVAVLLILLLLGAYCAYKIRSLEGQLAAVTANDGLIATASDNIRAVRMWGEKGHILGNVAADIVAIKKWNEGDGVLVGIANDARTTKGWGNPDGLLDKLANVAAASKKDRQLAVWAAVLEASAATRAEAVKAVREEVKVLDERLGGMAKSGELAGAIAAIPASQPARPLEVEVEVER
ncbi:MAG: hypothetical protein Q7S66_01550 [bacterium]|nr:hypothetical protein [bacterium]